jgi:hypothetical protein
MLVDGDVLEVQFPSKTERIPLTKLAVRVERQRKGRVQLHIQWGGEDEPLYAVGWTPTIKGHIWKIDAEEEPAYREFFAQVGTVCGRPLSDPSEADPGGATEEESSSLRRRRWGKGSHHDSE